MAKDLCRNVVEKHHIIKTYKRLVRKYKRPTMMKAINLQ
jgi:hypothetical protein